MNTDNICKALYALPGGVVTPRKESIVMPVVIVIIGVAMLISNYTIISSNLESLSMLMLVVGIALILYGALVLIMRIGSQRLVPYDNRAGRYFKFKERYFERELIAPVSQAIARGDIIAIDDMPTTNVSAIVLVECRSKGGIVAYCLYEFNNNEYHALGKPTILGYNG